jgi:hypothetical protein
MGGTQLLAGDGVTFSGPRRGTAYLDSPNGDIIVLHAIHLPDGTPYDSRETEFHPVPDAKGASKQVLETATRDAKLNPVPQWSRA